MTCEYDGTPLTYDSRGREEACPVCEADNAAHWARCRNCRRTPYLPERMPALTPEFLEALAATNAF